ncbi:energy transducer TonB [Sphingomonas sp.]|uniref:energy transducer TonB n=1 Tax=Sphingomonas sp. TaxID=28214 RepID=UPI003B00C193
MTTLGKRDRLAAASIASGVVLLLLWALVAGLAIGRGGRIDDGLKLFGVLPPDPPPPEKVVPPRVRNYRPAGAAAPPNLRAKPTEIVAPTPVIVLPVPPTVVVAPVASTDVQSSAGAADVAGPGTGAGGEGNGFGAGGDGDGDGAGDVPPRRTGGRIRDSDYPLDAGEQGVSGTVGVRFVVDVRGRVSRCAVTRSSGSRLLDDTTCRLIVQRYRFRPGHDARGVPFESTIVENETWVIHDEPAEE